MPFNPNDSKTVQKQLRRIERREAKHLDLDNMARSLSIRREEGEFVRRRLQSRADRQMVSKF